MTKTRFRRLCQSDGWIYVFLSIFMTFLQNTVGSDLRKFELCPDMTPENGSTIWTSEGQNFSIPICVINGNKVDPDPQIYAMKEGKESSYKSSISKTMPEDSQDIAMTIHVSVNSEDFGLQFYVVVTDSYYSSSSNQKAIYTFRLEEKVCGKGQYVNLSESNMPTCEACPYNTFMRHARHSHTSCVSCSGLNDTDLPPSCPPIMSEGRCNLYNQSDNQDVKSNKEDFTKVIVPVVVGGLVLTIVIVIGFLYRKLRRTQTSHQDPSSSPMVTGVQDQP